MRVIGASVECPDCQGEARSARFPVRQNVYEKLARHLSVAARLLCPEDWYAKPDCLPAASAALSLREPAQTSVITTLDPIQSAVMAVSISIAQAQTIAMPSSARLLRVPLSSIRALERLITGGEPQTQPQPLLHPELSTSKLAKELHFSCCPSTLR